MTVWTDTDDGACAVSHVRIPGGDKRELRPTLGDSGRFSYAWLKRGVSSVDAHGGGMEVISVYILIRIPTSHVAAAVAWQVPCVSRWGRKVSVTDEGKVVTFLSLCVTAAPRIGGGVWKVRSELGFPAVASVLCWAAVRIEIRVNVGTERMVCVPEC
ncbi:hypothetical protein E2C01_010585 [Portunus trituberculatus]|uniref:Uncharacterized protein n=1 Tax=Portunus trituberculatus TaxID=210409 RepID=A0A5B7D8U8_PORTR|nr:hypothetical protein [Portunus trituberculatus]